jgi:hypothetical protein
METTNNPLNQAAAEQAQAKTYNAFEVLSPKENTGAHVIDAQIQVTEDAIIIGIPFADMAKARPSANAKGNGVGFMLSPITFNYAGKTFSLKPGWTSLKAK